MRPKKSHQTILVPQERAQALKNELRQFGCEFTPVRLNDYNGPDGARRIGYKLVTGQPSYGSIQELLSRHAAEEVTE